ncbi:MAG: bacteriocin [Lachnospiraceae bacterium]|nr:bacteriocin [Lachnospiraceae bacterium]
MESNYGISFKNMEISELENISGGGPGDLAYDLAYYVGKKLRDNYCSRKGFHISTNGNACGGGGRRF